VVQPLVENAVKHGLRPRGGTGRVVLSTRRVGATLQVTVVDDGAGLAHLSRADGTGTGLANVRERLHQLYGEEHSFELAPASTGGARARIRIPFAEQPRGGPGAGPAPAVQGV
jgi:LytS/YehU family sensor histidine kinase